MQNREKKLENRGKNSEGTHIVTCGLTQSLASKRTIVGHWSYGRLIPDDLYCCSCRFTTIRTMHSLGDQSDFQIIIAHALVLFLPSFLPRSKPWYWRVASSSFINSWWLCTSCHIYRWLQERQLKGILLKPIRCEPIWIVSFLSSSGDSYFNEDKVSRIVMHKFSGCNFSQGVYTNRKLNRWFLTIIGESTVNSIFQVKSAASIFYCGRSWGRCFQFFFCKNHHFDFSEVWKAILHWFHYELSLNFVHWPCPAAIVHHHWSHLHVVLLINCLL